MCTSALRTPPPFQFYDFFRLGSSDRVYGSLQFLALGFYNCDPIGIQFGSIWKPFGRLSVAFWMPFGCLLDAFSNFVGCFLDTGTSQEPILTFS